MIKEILHGMDLMLFTELSLVLFAAVFAAVLVRTLRTDRETTERRASIVFGDETQEGEP